MMMEWLKDTAAALRLGFVGIEGKPAVLLRVVLKKTPRAALRHKLKGRGRPGKAKKIYYFIGFT